MRIRPHKSSEREREANLCLNGSFKTVPRRRRLSPTNHFAHVALNKKKASEQLFSGNNCFHADDFKTEAKKSSEKNVSFLGTTVSTHAE